MWRHRPATALAATAILPRASTCWNASTYLVDRRKGVARDQNQARLKPLWRIVTAQESADYSSLGALDTEVWAAL
jgi:hypothetical protein